jgi:hypothetical protein
MSHANLFQKLSLAYRYVLWFFPWKTYLKKHSYKANIDMKWIERIDKEHRQQLDYSGVILPGCRGGYAEVLDICQLKEYYCECNLNDYKEWCGVCDNCDSSCRCSKVKREESLLIVLLFIVRTQPTALRFNSQHSICTQSAVPLQSILPLD